LCLTLPTEGFPWDDLRKILPECRSTDGQRTKWRIKIAENFNRLSRVHERYSQTDRRTDGQAMTSLKIITQNWTVFTALHVMQTPYCEENSVCPSVRHTRGL